LLFSSGARKNTAGDPKTLALPIGLRILGAGTRLGVFSTIPPSFPYEMGSNAATKHKTRDNMKAGCTFYEGISTDKKK
jgi:hypothetical protein